MAAPDLAFERGLPANPDAERFVIGSVLLNGALFLQVAGAIDEEDFSLEKHRRIWARVKDLYARGEEIDRMTVADELMKHGQLESVDGLSYLASLDEGIPELENLDAYVRIVSGRSMLRKMIRGSQKIIDLCLLGQHEPEIGRAHV